MNTLVILATLAFAAIDTPTPIVTIPVSDTPTPVPTTSPTVSTSPTFTGSLTLTNSATQTPTGTFSTSRTPTITMSETPTRTFTVTASTSLSNTPTLSPTPYTILQEPISPPYNVLLYTQLAIQPGDTVANTVTETAFQDSSLIIGVAVPGMVYSLDTGGTFTTGLSPTTLRVRVYVGGQVVSDSGVIAVAASLANAGWSANFQGVITDVTSNVIASIQGSAVTLNGTTFAGPVASYSFTPGVPVFVDVTAQWGLASASNVITLGQTLFHAQRATP